MNKNVLFRIIPMVLIVIMCLSCLIGCNNDETENETQEKETTTKQVDILCFSYSEVKDNEEIATWLDACVNAKRKDFIFTLRYYNFAEGFFEYLIYNPTATAESYTATYYLTESSAKVVATFTSPKEESPVSSTDANEDIVVYYFTAPCEGKPSLEIVWDETSALIGKTELADATLALKK